MRIGKRDTSGHEESTRALMDAQQNLKRTRERTNEVQRVSRALRLLREQNHFIEHLEIIFTRGAQ